jgi:hypothetical protein
MNTTHNTTTKRLRLAAVAVATPALLFASAGTAQAWPIPEPWPNTDDVSTPSDTNAQAQDEPGITQPYPALSPGPWGTIGSGNPSTQAGQQQPDPPDIYPDPPYIPPGSQATRRDGQWVVEPATTMGPYTGPWPPPKVENPYCSPVFWPNNLPSEGTGNPCPP